MKAKNTLAPTLEAKKKINFSTAINSASLKKMMMDSLGDSRAVARLTSTLISAVAQTPKLQECEASTIVAAALRGEGMGLIYGQGYYVIPYGDVAQYALSYKGFIQLAMSTGFYADIDARDIRAGELNGRDPRTGRWRINLALYEDDETREAQPIIGYYAYFELKDGTFRSEYWSLDKLLKHADRYSPAFSLEKFRRLKAGETTPEETKKLLSGTPWYDEGEGQAKKYKKTVLRQLLNSGYAPLSNEVRSILREESRGEEAEEPIFDNIIQTQEVVQDAPDAALDAPEESGGTNHEEGGKNAQETQEKVSEGDPIASFFDAAEG